MTICEGEKLNDYRYLFPSGCKLNYKYLVEIGLDLNSEADPEWFGSYSSSDFDSPNFQIIITKNVETYEEAKKLHLLWTDERLRLWVSKPVLWWTLGTAPYNRGWMTPKGKAKWRRNYARYGWEIASQLNVDADWRHGITREWLFDVEMWQTHGRTYTKCKKWWEPDEAPKEVLDHYDKMGKVKARLESQECPDPIKKWYESMISI